MAKSLLQGSKVANSIVAIGIFFKVVIMKPKLYKI